MSYENLIGGSGGEGLATEAKQDDIITAIENISGGAFTSQYPEGATPFSVTATSSANSAGLAEVSAVSGKQHYVLGYLVALRAASASADILITLKDNTTVKLTDVIGNASPVGTSVSIVNSMPIIIGTANTNMNLGATAGGTGAITELTIWGYTL